MQPRASRLPRPAARGFTLAEVLVALLLLAWGALAMVAASAGAVRAVGSADAQERAALAARARVERLASNGCAIPGAGSGVDSSRALREAWAIARVDNGARLITDTVTPIDRGVPGRPIVVSRLVLC